MSPPQMREPGESEQVPQDSPAATSSVALGSFGVGSRVLITRAIVQIRAWRSPVIAS